MVTKLMVLLLMLSVLCTGCILIPAGYAVFGTVATTSAAKRDRDKASEGQGQEGKLTTTPPKEGRP